MKEKVIKENVIAPTDIAEFFLTKQAMTQKKLQKLVYYSYAWFIALYNDNQNDISNRLFEERPEAWVHGPVFRSLYALYKENGWHDIPKLNKEIVFADSEIQGFLETIWEKFGRYDGNQLESMTHYEMPWRNARGDAAPADACHTKISDRDIFVYYNELSQTPQTHHC